MPWAAAPWPFPSGSRHRGRCAATIGLLGVATPAAADTTGFVQGGDGDRAIESAVSFYGEFVVGEWFVHEPRTGDRSRFTQFGLTPVLRSAAVRSSRLASGSMSSRRKFRDNDRMFSTRFNFADHVAIGTRFGPAQANEISLRAEHFSNGGIRHPNPGQNFVELRYARHF